MEEGHQHSYEEFRDRLRKAFEEAMSKQEVVYTIHPKMTEEELVDVLSQFDPAEAGLDFFIDLGSKFYGSESWELLNVVKTHIEYNFDVELINEKGKTKYEIRKKL